MRKKLDSNQPIQMSMKRLFYPIVFMFIVVLLNHIATAQVVPGHYIVVFKDNVADANVAAADIVRAHGFNLTHTYSFALKGFAADIPAEKLAALQQDPRVAYVEPDLVVTAFGHLTPTGVNRIDADLNSIAKIDDVDDRVNVDIAIIDTGIDLDHPDLNVFYDQNFIDRSKRGDDDHGHGTHVAGTAAALDNGFGVVGVAPGARLWALKVLNANGSGSFSDVIAAINFVTSRASEIEVVNMSLGGVGRLDSLRTAIQNCVNAGVVIVVAAGNSSRDVYGPDGVFETSDDTIPAAYPEVMTISAMVDTDGKPGGDGPSSRYGADDTFASFSNFSRSVVPANPVTSPGAAIDCAAPGVDIFSTWKNGGYNTSSGTSMASPHMAGAAALYIVANGRPRNASNVATVRQALINTAQPQTAWRRGLPTGDPDPNPEGMIQVNDEELPTCHTGSMIDGWRFGGRANGIPASLAGPFLSTYDGVVFAELGPNGEAVWKKSTEGDGWLCKELQIPPLPSDGGKSDDGKSDGGKIYLTFWYDWVASAEDGVPPGEVEFFLAGKSRLKLAPSRTASMDRHVQWDVTEYAGSTVPFEVKYWFKIISHGFGPTTGFWVEFIGVSLNTVKATGYENNTSNQISGAGEIVMRNDQRDIKKDEEFIIDLFGENGGVVWFVPIEPIPQPKPPPPPKDPPLRIPHQPSGAYSATIRLLPEWRYQVTEEYEIGITSLGMVGALHPVHESYRYETHKSDFQFLVTWTISNIFVEISGDDVEGSASDLTANWLQVKAKAKRDIKLGEVVRAGVKYSATYIKRSSIQ